MIIPIRPCTHSRRAKKLVLVGNARRQARIPIQVRIAVGKVNFFAYLLTVDASGLNRVGGQQSDGSPLRADSNGTSGDSGMELLHRAVWAQIVAQRHQVHGDGVPVQIFARQERVTFVEVADILLEPDLDWAESRLQEAGIRLQSHVLMPVIPQPSLVTCSLLLVDRSEEDAVILVGNEVLDRHVVPRGISMIQLQQEIGVFLCRDHCAQYFPSDHRIASGQWFRSNEKNDDVSFMQRHPGLPLEVNPEVLVGEAWVGTGVAVRVWFHNHMQVHGFRSFSKFVCIKQMRCPAFAIVQMFSHELGPSLYDLAPVHNSGVRGRHFVLTTRGAFEGAVVLVQSVQQRSLAQCFFARVGMIAMLPLSWIECNQAIIVRVVWSAGLSKKETSGFMVKCFLYDMAGFSVSSLMKLPRHGALLDPLVPVTVYLRHLRSCMMILSWLFPV